MREFISYEPGSPDRISLYMRVGFCFGCPDPLGNVPPHSFRFDEFYSVDGTRNACRIIPSTYHYTCLWTQLQYYNIPDAHVFRMYTVHWTHSSPTKAAKSWIRIYIAKPKFKKIYNFFRSYVCISNIVRLSVTKMKWITGRRWQNRGLTQCW